MENKSTAFAIYNQFTGEWAQKRTKMDKFGPLPILFRTKGQAEGYQKKYGTGGQVVKIALKIVQ